MSRVVGHYQAKAVSVTDKRISLTSEILSCIKLIKMYAWENNFTNNLSGEYLYLTNKLLKCLDAIIIFSLQITSYNTTTATALTLADLCLLFVCVNPILCFLCLSLSWPNCGQGHLIFLIFLSYKFPCFGFGPQVGPCLKLGPSRCKIV